MTNDRSKADHPDYCLRAGVEGSTSMRSGRASKGADMDYDDEISQVMIGGGVYLAPSDTAKLCDPCCALLSLVWDAEKKKDAPCLAATSQNSGSAA
jgi:hypothetical protein